ncbi:MAG: chorismate mutase [Chloroflexota bacterium]|nr:chorismate mutase [Chloroflexota bacterium]
MHCRGIRGATTVGANTRDDILAATEELLRQMVDANDVKVEDIAFILFTTTQDLNAEFPAVAAREMGFTRSALMCGHEMNVPGSLSLCLRILVLWNTERGLDDVVHVYTKGAWTLRPTVGDINTRDDVED